MERWLNVLARAVLWGVAAVLSLLVLAVALVLLLVGWLWALCRGRRLEVPASLAQLRRWQEQQMRRAGGRSPAPDEAEVVDVQGREVERPLARLPAPQRNASDADVVDVSPKDGTRPPPGQGPG